MNDRPFDIIFDHCEAKLDQRSFPCVLGTIILFADDGKPSPLEIPAFARACPPVEMRYGGILLQWDAPVYFYAALTAYLATESLAAFIAVKDGDDFICCWNRAVPQRIRGSEIATPKLGDRLVVEKLL